MKDKSSYDQLKPQKWNNAVLLWVRPPHKNPLSLYEVTFNLIILCIDINFLNAVEVKKANIIKTLCCRDDKALEDIVRRSNTQKYSFSVDTTGKYIKMRFIKKQQKKKLKTKVNRTPAGKKLN